jgi:predicted nucleic acid-binding protein
VTLVVDSSVVVAALVSQGEQATEWAEQTLLSASLAAPHFLYAEVANQLRRFAFNGLLSQDVASLAYAQLCEMPIDLFPFEPVAERVWELRKNVTAYDAWYVALAELLGAPLATLDLRLTRAQGPTCPFLTPPPA